MPQDSHSEWGEGRVFCDDFMRKEVALETGFEGRWDFTLKTVRDDVSWGGKNESTGVNIRCVQDAIGKGFRGGAVVKNPHANAGDTGSSPGLGRSHMPRGN